MKRYIFLILLSCLIVDAKNAKRYKVDGIKVKICGENETILITESELLRPSLDGQPKTLDSMIFESTVYIDAQRLGIVPTDEDNDKRWQEVQKQNNLSLADMERMVEQTGRTVAEAKAELGKMSAISQMFDFKVRSNLFITQRDVETYHREHPEFRQAEYYISRAIVPFSDFEPKHQMKQRLEEFVTTGRGAVRFAWSEPFWIKHDYVAEDKRFIYDMKVGQISLPFELGNGFELFKLIDKKQQCLVPLQERYEDIATLLRKPKYEQLLDQYKKELYDKATIIYY